MSELKSKQKTTQIKLAYDSSGNVVLASQAERCRHYICPDCNGELTFKHGKQRAPHFAHMGGGGHNCCNESVLHETFKKKVLEILQEKISNGVSMPVSWKCSACGRNYQDRNILTKIKKVEMESRHDNIRPDISLLDESGKLIAGIEIVVTHWPEEKALETYRNEGIILLEYDIYPEDLQNVESKLAHPDSVSFCVNTKCSAFNEKMFERKIYSDSYRCPNCGRGVFLFSTFLVCEAFGAYVTTDINQKEFDDVRKSYPASCTIEIGPNKNLAIRTMCACQAKPRVISPNQKDWLESIFEKGPRRQNPYYRPSSSKKSGTYSQKRRPKR